MNVVTIITTTISLIRKIKEKIMCESSKYSQFKNYILFQEDFLFKISLYFIFNEENAIKTSNNNVPKFMLTYEKFKEYLIKLRNYAKNSCGIKCQSDEMCLGHKTLNLMQEYDDFMFDSVERKSLYFKHVKFIKFKDDNEPMFSYVLIATNEVDLGWKTWSQRMSYLL